MSVAKKLYYRCTECQTKTSTTNRARAALKVCVNCRPDLDAAPTKTKAPKPCAAALAPRARNGNGAASAAVVMSTPPAPGGVEDVASVIERVPETLAKVRKLIGFPSADFEGFRRKGFAVGYFYEQPADAPGKKMAVEFTKRRLTDPQFVTKFGALHRRGKRAGTRVTEFLLDPAAPENKGDAAPGDAKGVQPAKGKKVSALDAAAMVLRAWNAPMTPAAIYAAIVAGGLWVTKRGKTPWLTIGAAMGREIAAGGADCRFVKTARGQFAANPAIV